MERRKFAQHWPVILLSVVVIAIFTAVLICFEVKQTEYAVVLRFGRPRAAEDGTIKVYGAGLHMRWPYPIETVWRHDNRLQCYELQTGQVEQVQTADDYQVILTTYVLWRVGDAGLFLRRINTTAEAEAKLDDIVRNSRNTAIGRHRLTAMINVDSEQVRLRDIENEILDYLRDVAMSKYGIAVEHVGFKHIGFPERVSTKVFARMRAERNRRSERYRAEGKRDAQRIRSRADYEVSKILAEAEAASTRIRAEGDSEAAGHYAVFRENPELAAVLRKLDSLRLTLAQKTTLILDTNTPPYDLLLPGAINIEQEAAETATGQEAKGARK